MGTKGEPKDAFHVQGRKLINHVNCCKCEMDRYLDSVRNGRSGVANVRLGKDSDSVKNGYIIYYFFIFLFF